MRKDNLQMGILKGIAIVSVVFGHACYWSVEFVYMYHLPLFFFVTGYLYNEEKYGNNIKLLFASRMYSIMPQYLGYSILLFATRNWMVARGLYNETVVKMTLVDFIQNLIGATYFGATELVGSSFWFLPVLITAVMIYGSVIYISNKFDDKYTKLARYIGVATSGLIGIWLINKGIVVSFHLENAFLVVPLLAAGQWYRRHKLLLDNQLDWIVATVLLICFSIIPKITGTYVELSTDQIINPWFFYMIVLMAICFWIFISLKIEKVNVLSYLLNLCGKYSLDIMALHLLVVKLVDYIYLEYINPTAGVKSAFVYSVKELWPIYIFAGIAVPIIFRICINYFFATVSTQLRKRNILRP